MSSKKARQKRVIGVLTGDQRNEKAGLVNFWDEEDRFALEKFKGAIEEIPEYTWVFLDNHDDLMRRLREIEKEVDIVLNLCDDGFRNDSRMELHIPALLDTLGILYTGGDPRCLATCNDKSLVRGAARELGIPVPQGIFIQSPNEISLPPFGFPVIVKPNFGDGGVGITRTSVVNNKKEFHSSVQEILNMGWHRNGVLAEEFLSGRDLTVALIGNPKEHLHLFAIAEKNYETLDINLPKIWGHEGKWEKESPYYHLPTTLARLPRAVKTFLRQANTLLFERLGCRDYARIDWRLDAKGMPRLLEVNPNPGWWWDGSLAKIAAMKRMSYSEMIRTILKSAEKRLRIA